MGQHLTKCRRHQIESFRGIGMSQKWVANRVGVSPSTIFREMKRNKSQDGYVATEAHAKATKRRGSESRSPKRMVPEMVEEIELRIKDTWSPEQVAGFLKMRGTPISYGTIYHLIRTDKKKGGTFVQMSQAWQETLQTQKRIHRWAQAHSKSY